MRFKIKAFRRRHIPAAYKAGSFRPAQDKIPFYSDQSIPLKIYNFVIYVGDF